MDFASSRPRSGTIGSLQAGRVLGVIPARLGSSRLPRKPLQNLLGRPLVRWVGERALAMKTLDDAVVATDADEVRSVCSAAGIPCVLTDPGHPSGTDRVAQVAEMPAYAGFDIVVNLQGDEPLMAGSHVDAAVRKVREGADVGTCATPVGGEAAWRSPSVVKVVCGEDGRALYFSRAPIPHPRDGLGDDGGWRDGTFLRHLGLYAYSREALRRWVALPPSPLEELEKLEQLRALQAGMRIGVAVVDSAERGVDTPEDVAAIEQRMRELGLGE